MVSNMATVFTIKNCSLGVLTWTLTTIHGEATPFSSSKPHAIKVKVKLLNMHQQIGQKHINSFSWVHMHSTYFESKGYKIRSPTLSNFVIWYITYHFQLEWHIRHIVSTSICYSCFLLVMERGFQRTKVGLIWTSYEKFMRVQILLVDDPKGRLGVWNIIICVVAFDTTL